MKSRVSIGRELRVVGMAALAMGLALSSAYSAAPPPPDGPPAPIMTGIAVSGPAVVDEGTTAQFVCTASYSDGTSGMLSAVWNVDSAAATINAAWAIDKPREVEKRAGAILLGSDDYRDLAYRFADDAVHAITKMGESSLVEDNEPALRQWFASAIRRVADKSLAVNRSQGRAE